MDEGNPQQGMMGAGQGGSQGDGTSGTTPTGMGNPPMAGASTDDIQTEAIEDDVDLDSYLGVLQPPEPRGSAYKDTGAFQAFSTILKLPEHPITNFDEKYLLYMFARSLSLTIKDKRDILLERLPSLAQFQVDELIKILEEEKQKFDQLGEKHPDQVKNLQETAQKEWSLLEMETTKITKQDEDQSQADEIRKKLGLG